ncbi:MAG: TIGR04283 family arsenosugar biosynthesis glycosyltransferase [Spirochaetia bacterium]|nr:TIGR04283 family arsenosugar biosynthesis glycosyltransferase [Spirochaetia bacterium]
MDNKISIIIPTLNESEFIGKLLPALQEFRKRGHELIIADGGSSDLTVQIAKDHSDRIVFSKKGRAKQMNAGADAASHEIFWFLHADSIPHSDSDRFILKEFQNKKKGWGYFKTRLSGNSILFRLIEFFMNLRSGLTSVATGDQGIFVRKDSFLIAGKFPEIELMEDIALSKTLKNICRPSRLSLIMITSSRRWEQKGVFKTILLMWYLRLAYISGIHPRKLQALYR